VLANLPRWVASLRQLPSSYSIFEEVPAEVGGAPNVNAVPANRAV